MRNVAKTAVVLAAILCAGTASATTLSFNYSGMVERTNAGDNSDVPNIGPFQVGDAFTGTFQLDTAAPAGSGNATDQTYTGAVSGFSLTIGGLTFASNDPTNDFRVRNNHMAGSAAPLRDSVILSAFNISGSTIAGLTPAGIQFAIGGTDTSVLSSLAMPSVSQFDALFAADTLAGNLNFLTLSDGSDVRLRIDRMSVTDVNAPPVVPLPATAPLLIFGLGGLIALRRRQR